MPSTVNSNSFKRNIWYTLSLLVILVCTFTLSVIAEKTIDAANEQRLNSFLLADELRQSSDDLTRMAQLYVVSGDRRQSQYYQDILDIRDGKKPRPVNYGGIYWDLVLATGTPPTAESKRTKPLLELMREAGFTEQELSVLSKAKVFSDRLTQTEREAMQLRQSENGKEKASQMLHDFAYLNAKAAIMKPIDDFYGLMTARTNNAVSNAEHRALLIRILFIGLAVLSLLMLYRTSRALRVIMGGSVGEVHEEITRIGNGDFSKPLAVTESLQGSVLARLAEMQSKLKQITDQHQSAQAELRQSEVNLKIAQQLAQIGNWDINRSTGEVIWSDEVYRIYEVTPDTFTPSAHSFVDATHPDDRVLLSRRYNDAIENKTAYEITRRLLLKDGQIKYVNERGKPFYQEDGHVLHLIGTVQDVTASKLSELALKRLNRDLRLLSDCNMALVRAEDEHTLLNEISRLCVESGGYLMAWVGYAEYDDARTVKPVAQSGYENGYLDGINISWGGNALGSGPVGSAIRTGEPTTIQNVLTDERMRPWRTAAIQRGYRSSIGLPLIHNEHTIGALTLYSSEANAFDAEEIRLLMELANDLAFGIINLRTRAAHAEAKLKLDFLANFDSLTHLPNRTLLQDRFEHAAMIADNENTMVSLLYLDLDHFKHINDSLGYATGDRVLIKVVERLRQCIPETATISRLSGDEFVVLLAGKRDAIGVAGMANTISDIFIDPVDIDGNTLNISCSIGIGLYPEDGKDFDTLLKHTHAAVDSAKEAGRNTYCFFSHEMNSGLTEQIRLTGGLVHALRNQEFRIHYQPQSDIHSGKIIGAEALLRWQHPVDGLISPGKFISLAERSGHIVPIGEWVLNEACRQAVSWLRDHPDAPVVAVNLSALQFKRGKILDVVANALTKSGLPPHQLELELTESILLQDVGATINILHGLKNLGVKLSIDDFGTGYSSLSYLKQLAVDKLKIDQSFVRDMLTSADGAAIVKTIIQLGHNLQLTVIAEGVETKEQLACLNEYGCDEVQGYLLSHPLPADELSRLLTERSGTLTVD
ncbi:EAL domain-containing protein [Undibacterium sp. 14-3-2]|uniref:EAL domain-containing protein n=1 Tax=Undibacterium sp. 14-3-2 TaxID=2800129 RepID=UPI0019048640|nr:EAL domain-containing protein [Undibacterium sp. 14-3-2]MBK1890910.1 EAL domain-containing protein [Undibacterium sp. 14-3-2]